MIGFTIERSKACDKSSAKDKVVINETVVRVLQFT